MTTAAPLPHSTACFCCLAGSDRAASAITTALSPDNTMLTPMICSRATQNVGSSSVMSEGPSRANDPAPRGAASGALVVAASVGALSSCAFLRERFLALLAQRRRQHDEQQDGGEGEHHRA